jgi:hypothetical protein
VLALHFLHIQPMFVYEVMLLFSLLYVQTQLASCLYFRINASQHLYYSLLLFHQHVNELLCQPFSEWVVPRWLTLLNMPSGPTM